MKTTLILALVAILATPLASPAATTCGNPCGVTATSLLYELPANVIASGTTVSFTTGDTTHVTADGGIPIVASATSCFQLTQSPGGGATSVTFTISGGALLANTGSGNVTCTNAVALPGGAFALPFYCKLHTNMRGVLVVEP